VVQGIQERVSGIDYLAKASIGIPVHAAHLLTSGLLLDLTLIDTNAVGPEGWKWMPVSFDRPGQLVVSPGVGKHFIRNGIFAVLE
jgi:hypothetical protein